MGIFFAFFLSLCPGSKVHAQQENDDPNWRERKLERLKKEIEELTKKFEEAERKLEKLAPSHHGTSPILNPRFLEIYDYGPSPMRRRLTEVKRFHPFARPDG
jgi:hypothetical protein